MTINDSKNNGAVAQLGERLDGIQKVVGSIPSSSTIINVLKYILVLTFLKSYVHADSIESHKLLIPGESFKSESQKNFEILNFKKSKISYLEFRKKKCYKKAFVIFPRSKLCTHDPHMCAQDFAVEEMHYFLRYKRLLLDISEVCAQGYPIDYSDADVVKGNSSKDVKEFIIYLKGKKKVDYDYPNVPKSSVNTKVPRKIKQQTGAHGAVPIPENNSIKNYEDKKNFDNLKSNELEIKEKEENLIKLEKTLQLEKKLLEEEKTLYEQKKRLKELESKILESEKALREKKR